MLTDLKQRGLLEDTLVLFGSEFGRLPTAQGVDGRDHNIMGYSMFLAGAGVKKGFTYGATDEFGIKAVDGRMHTTARSARHEPGKIDTTNPAASLRIREPTGPPEARHLLTDAPMASSGLA